MDEEILKEKLYLIGQEIKKLRERKNLSQLGVSEKIDFPQSYLSKIELGKKNITLETLWDLLDALNADIYIVERNDLAKFKKKYGIE